jgi:hypothetical protein
MDAAWFDAVRQRFADEVAYNCATRAWVRVAERINPRYAKVANIPLNNVMDSMKVLQLPVGIHYRWVAVSLSFSRFLGWLEGETTIHMGINEYSFHHRNMCTLLPR